MLTTMIDSSPTMAKPIIFVDMRFVSPSEVALRPSILSRLSNSFSFWFSSHPNSRSRFSESDLSGSISNSMSYRPDWMLTASLTRASSMLRMQKEQVESMGASLWILKFSITFLDCLQKIEFHFPSTMLLTSTSYFPSDFGRVSTENFCWASEQATKLRKISKKQCFSYDSRLIVSLVEVQRTTTASKYTNFCIIQNINNKIYATITTKKHRGYHLLWVSQSKNQYEKEDCRLVIFQVINNKQQSSMTGDSPFGGHFHMTDL